MKKVNLKFKIFIVSLSCFMFFGWAESSWAADWYIRDGATGATCADWGANACDNLPALLTRGDTYYIADGNYGSWWLDDANSGTLTITIKKATTADHGTATGWSGAYGDGQAVFGSVGLGSDYWVFDGQVRNNSDWSDGTAYGFKSNAGGFFANTGWFAGVCASHVTIKYVNCGNLDGTTYTGNEEDSCVYIAGFDELCADWNISDSFMHNNDAPGFHLNGVDGFVIERNYISDSWGKESIRGQIALKNTTIRYNYFHDACGSTGLPGEGCTAEIAAWDGDAGSWDNNKIYGNVFHRTRDENSGGTIVIGGDGAGWAGAPANGTLIFNNTIAGISGGGMGGDIIVPSGTNTQCRNNLWWDTISAHPYCGVESNNVDAASDPFVDYASGNLRLALPTVAGYTLSAPYDLDMDSNTRGADGTWDIGAYEYVSAGGDTTPPAAPSGLSVI